MDCDLGSSVCPSVALLVMMIERIFRLSICLLISRVEVASRADTKSEAIQNHNVETEREMREMERL